MKVTESQVTKLMITDVPNLDPIAVIVENFGPGAGKITITCFGEAWSNYWGSMGEQYTLESFFCKCSEDYLANKLKSGIRQMTDDEDEEALEKLLKVEIIKDRRVNAFSHEKARDLWNQASYVSYGDHVDLCREVLGDEWWHKTPKKENHEYQYLCRIIRTVQEAFKQQAGIK